MINDDDAEQMTGTDYGEIIIEEERLKEDYTKIPNTILRRSDISPGAKWCIHQVRCSLCKPVASWRRSQSACSGFGGCTTKLTYVMLLSYAHKADRCFPGQRRLAEEMGVAVRSVIRYMQELVKALLLRVKRRGLGKTNLYYLSQWSKPKAGGTERESAEAPLEVNDEVDVAGHGGSDNFALQQMPNRQREKNKSEQDKIENGVETYSLEERGVRHDWQPIGELVKHGLQTRVDRSEREEWLAGQVLAQTGDAHSLNCYRLIARSCPPDLVFEALSELKQVGYSGQVRRSKGALFLSIVRRRCQEWGIKDPLGKRAVSITAQAPISQQAADP